MADIPIIFSGPMVRALLDGRKTMTRRLAWKVAPEFHDGGVIYNAAGGQEDYVEPSVTEGKPSPWQKVKPGDRLWVREAICRDWEPTIYRADEIAEYGRATADHNNRWTPSIHMPRKASRLTLAVTATKIERAQNISEADAQAEGARQFPDIPVNTSFTYSPPCRWSMENPKGTDQCLSTARFAFANYWIKLHGQPSWDENPEVVALTFTVHKTNIDQLAKAA